MKPFEEDVLLVLCRRDAGFGDISGIRFVVFLNVVNGHVHPCRKRFVRMLRLPRGDARPFPALNRRAGVLDVVVHLPVVQAMEQRDPFRGYGFAGDRIFISGAQSARFARETDIRIIGTVFTARLACLHIRFPFRLCGL